MRAIATVLAISTLATGCTGRVEAPPRDVVAVRGTQLPRDGAPYHFVGANLWYGCNLAALAEGGDRERLRRELDSYSPSAATTVRDRFFDTVLGHIAANAAAGGAFAGSNFWTWGGYGTPANPDDPAWHHGDSFTGDPPMEPQGRNSVFATDASTLVLLERQAARMRAVGR